MYQILTPTGPMTFDGETKYFSTEHAALIFIKFEGILSYEVVKTSEA